MSIEAVLARVDQIMVAQRQLSHTPQVVNSGAEAGTVQGVSGAPAAASTSFADRLASAQSAQAQPADATGFPPASGIPGAVIPQTSWNPEHKPIAAWIAPILEWASQHGWTGTVTSGYRSYAQQAAINASGAYSAPAGKSNHETTPTPVAPSTSPNRASCSRTTAARTSWSVACLGRLTPSTSRQPATDPHPPGTSPPGLYSTTSRL